MFVSRVHISDITLDRKSKVLCCGRISTLADTHTHTHTQTHTERHTHTDMHIHTHTHISIRIGFSLQKWNDPHYTHSAIISYINYHKWYTNKKKHWFESPRLISSNNMEYSFHSTAKRQTFIHFWIFYFNNKQTGI